MTLVASLVVTTVVPQVAERRMSLVRVSEQIEVGAQTVVAWGVLVVRVALVLVLDVRYLVAGFLVIPRDRRWVVRAFGRQAVRADPR